MLEHAGVVPTATRSKQCFCPASRARITRERCVDLTQGPQTNQRYCCKMRCQSPWRLCIKCIVQGHTGEDAQTTDPKTGWCLFHTINGESAVRSKNYYETRAAYCDSYPMRITTQEKDRIPGSSARTGGEMYFHDITNGHRHNVIVPPMVIAVDLQNVAEKIKKLPQRQQSELARKLGTCPTKSMEQIAQELKIKRNSLDCLFRHLYNSLGMPGRQYSVTEKRDIVYRAWQLAYPAE